MKNIKTTLILTFLTSILYLAGCSTTSPNSPTIVGTWNAVSIRQVDRSGSTTTLDTTTAIPSGYDIVTFASGGGFTDVSLGGGTMTGTYSTSGNTLTLFSTGNPQGVVYNMLTLSAHSLVEQRTDTTNRNPVSTIQYTFSYSR